MQYLFFVPAILISLTVHEFSHGYAAYLLGDTRAKKDGRLSLNPLRHIDPIGFICLLILHFGWAKPVMIDPSGFKDPKHDMAITAFAGPLSNLLLSFVCFLVMIPMETLYRGDSQVVVYFYVFIAHYLAPINISLALFNMIPLPPLDGSKVFGVALPDHIYFSWIGANRISTIILLIMIWTNAVGYVLSPIRTAFYQAMSFLAEKIYFFL